MNSVLIKEVSSNVEVCNKQAPLYTHSNSHEQCLQCWRGCNVGGGWLGWSGSGSSYKEGDSALLQINRRMKCFDYGTHGETEHMGEREE